MKIAGIHNRYYTVPASWNELSGRQLITILTLIHSQRSSDNVLLQLFKCIIGLSQWRLFLIPFYEISDNLYLVDFLLEGNTLTENVLPVYRHFHGPKRNFDNLLICEFVFTEAYFTIYDKKPISTADGSPALELTAQEKRELENERGAALNKLIAILYRPAKKNYDYKKNIDGDVREPFKDPLTEFYAKKIARWPMPVKMAIAHWYAGCRLQLVKDFPVVFTPTSNSQESAYGLWSVMRSIAEKGTFGDFAAVERQYVKTVMMELTESIRESERLSKTSTL